MQIGFIGLGIMGSRMAANLQKAGHDLMIYNRTREKAETLIKEGAQWCDTPAQLAEKVDILFTMLAHPEAVSQVAFGDDGIFRESETNAIWVDCSTVNPSFCQSHGGGSAKTSNQICRCPGYGHQKAGRGGATCILCRRQKRRC